LEPPVRLEFKNLLEGKEVKRAVEKVVEVKTYLVTIKSRFKQYI